MYFLYLIDGIHSRNVSLDVTITEVENNPGDNLPTKTPEKMELRRELGLFSAVNLIVGVMIGTVSSASEFIDITPLIIFPENDVIL
jgi:hypothetical protein